MATEQPAAPSSPINANEADLADARSLHTFLADGRLANGRPMAEQDTLAALRAENERLIGLLDAHGIQWRQPTESVPPASERETPVLSTREKVALFRRLFRGRDDVFPVRWENKTGSKSGYTPACANEWRVGLCDKPRIKCADCGHRVLIPLTDTVIYDHLAGKHTIGIYPLLEDDTCHFLAVDFDN